MQIIKLKQYKKPRYPDKSAIYHNPNLLNKLPVRWKNNAGIFFTLSSAILILLSSCKAKNINTDASLLTQVPFFEHGDGRGSFGCESVAPPCFLSEEEALSVINEITKREGFEFDKDGATLYNINIPQTNIYDYKQNEMKSYKKRDLILDGYNKDKKIAFEFVSKYDIESWQNENNGIMSTVSTYPFKLTAKALSEQINKGSNDMIIATFYDPDYNYESVSSIISNRNLNYNEREKTIKDIVKADLRLQVEDFITWLKSQNII